MHGTDRTGASPKSSHRWLLTAAIGFGFCLASTEYERYTALWTFNTRSLPELALIIGLLIVVLGFIVYRVRGGKRRFYRSKAFIAALVVMQSVGLFGRFMQSIGAPTPSWFALLTSVAMQSAGILFILYAEFFLEVGVKKTIRSFAFAVIIAGSLQILATGFDLFPAVAALFSFMPISAVLLVLADRWRHDATKESEQEDVRAELDDEESYPRDFPFWEYCLSITFLSILMLALHDQAMSLQDNGEGSRLIQMASGIGGLVSGMLFLGIINYLQESEVLELFRLIALPVVLAALYISALFSGSGIILYGILLNICYSIVLLFVWIVPRYYRRDGSPFLYVCIAYFSYRLGWAIGICGIMILPQRYGDFFETGLILLSFFVLLALSALHLIRHRRNNAQRLVTAKESADAHLSSDIAFAEACAHVAQEHQLTPREGEVLVLLAKGRNAKHIAETLVVSDGTARTHIMHIYQKMEIKSQQVLMDRVDEALAKQRES